MNVNLKFQKVINSQSFKKGLFSVAQNRYNLLTMEKNYNDEILSDLKEIRRSLKRTENNVAFFAILTIIGMVLYALIAIFLLG